MFTSQGCGYQEDEDLLFKEHSTYVLMGIPPPPPFMSVCIHSLISYFDFNFFLFNFYFRPKKRGS